MNADDPAPEQVDGLRRAWERRARSPLCPFFVSSHPSYADGTAWREQTLVDLRGLFLGVGPDRLAGLDVLEVGCGIGRLALELAPRVRSYAGFDIAPSMVEEARARCAGLANASFVVGSGDRVPEPLAGREYDFVFSLAVMIHVPREVALANLASAWARVRPGGELRFQFRADAGDGGPLDPLPADLSDLGAFAAPESVAERFEEDAVLRAELDRQTAQQEGEPSYMGHAFARADLEAAARALPDARARVLRPTPQFSFVLARRPAAT